jgi:hypothetical protein
MFQDFSYTTRGDALDEMASSTKRTKIEFDATGGGNREKGLNFKATSGKTGKVRAFREQPQKRRATVATGGRLQRERDTERRERAWNRAAGLEEASWRQGECSLLPLSCCMHADPKCPHLGHHLCRTE